MKFISALVCYLVTVMGCLAQQAFVNPTSVTLTRQGAVTIIVTDTVPTSSYTVTIDSIVAASSAASWTSADGNSIGVSNSAANGTLDAGTYPVTTDGSPKQVTVVLWNEPSSNGGLSVSQTQLVETSATTADQVSFQAFITTQAQQQIAVLQIQIASLEQSAPENIPMRAQLANMEATYDQLTNNMTITAVVTATNGQNGTNGSNGHDADSTLAYVGMGLGSAAFIGTAVNYFTQDDEKAEAPAKDSSEKSSK